MVLTQAAELSAGSMISESDKSPPLPELLSFDPSAKYRKVDNEFIQKTNSSRVYTCRLAKQANVTSKELNFTE
jgi:hypothetical protein